VVDNPSVDDSTPALRSDSLDLLFRLVEPAPSAQLKSVDALDAKVVQMFAAGSVLVGLAAVAGAHNGLAVSVCVAAAILAFLALAFQTVKALWLRRFRTTIAPDQLWRESWPESREAIKHAIVADIADGYAKNEERLNDKRQALGFALIALAVEATAIGVALAISAL
jgi:hypothetical protein